MTVEAQHERRWHPGPTMGWLFFGVEQPPVVAEDLAAIAIEEGLEPEEAETVLEIARLRELKTSPFVSVTKDEGSSVYTVEVIIPSGKTELEEVYRRYNG